MLGFIGKASTFKRAQVTAVLVISSDFQKLATINWPSFYKYLAALESSSSHLAWIPCTGTVKEEMVEFLLKNVNNREANAISRTANVLNIHQLCVHMRELWSASVCVFISTSINCSYFFHIEIGSLI